MPRLVRIERADPDMNERRIHTNIGTTRVPSTIEMHEIFCHLDAGHTVFARVEKVEGKLIYLGHKVEKVEVK